MANYIGRIAEVKNSDSPFYACVGVIRRVKNNIFEVQLPEGNIKFERGELRIKRKIAEKTYKVRTQQDDHTLALDSETTEIDADNVVDAVTQATGGDEYGKITVDAEGSRKGEPGRSQTKARVEPKTRVRNTLEALSYPYTISLPGSYAPLLERKSRGIYGLSVQKRYGRIYMTVENAEALIQLYSKLDTKRPDARSKTILEGIRSSTR